MRGQARFELAIHPPNGWVHYQLYHLAPRNKYPDFLRKQPIKSTKNEKKMINWGSLFVIWFIIYLFKQRRNQQLPPPPDSTPPPTPPPSQPPVVTPPPPVDMSKHQREMRMETLFPFLVKVRIDTDTETVNPNKQQYFLQDLKDTVISMFQRDGAENLKEDFEYNVQQYNKLYGPVFAG